MSEESLQIAVCNYLRLQYPKVLFNTDLSGIKLTKGQAVKVKNLRSCKGWPDIFIAHGNDKYHGLFIELKKEGEKLYKRNGDPVNEHVAEQIQMKIKLFQKGYAAEFAIGFDRAKQLIDDYMKLL